VTIIGDGEEEATDGRTEVWTNLDDELGENGLDPKEGEIE